MLINNISNQQTSYASQNSPVSSVAQNGGQNAASSQIGENEKSQIETTQENTQIQELKSTDAKVRAHERAHMAAGGDLILSGATYSYKIGPDGKFYAIAGEVQIDTSPVPDDPEATLSKAQRIVQAAMAPADPSSADRQVASAARSMAAQARGEIMREHYQEANEQSSGQDQAPQRLWEA